jgi:hypothetical protein
LQTVKVPTKQDIQAVNCEREVRKQQRKRKSDFEPDNLRIFLDENIISGQW